ncbi:hypothetical protein DLD77_01660 [Chitinophaga alhagiae]|uniref:Lipocalin-like domain-containing protein n=1 Tax=Chitinophaga alhagiae TaxID=2203219 RepID=A0ABN5LMB1_9BACT|nr:hypothetical protein [Chitinophaga alhagiae]AWO00502.1 hypothetical protein DLD77_01660 [Chitinophaga alhagiae]
MKKRISYLCIVFLLLCSCSLAQQKSTANFSDLICKEWKLVFYEEDGEKIPPAPQQKGDRMIFYKDNKVKSIEAGAIQNGIWQYDSVKKTLVVTDNSTKEKMIMKVLQINQDLCVLEFKDADGIVLKMHTAPAK